MCMVRTGADAGCGTSRTRHTPSRGRRALPRAIGAALAAAAGARGTPAGATQPRRGAAWGSQQTTPAALFGDRGPSEQHDKKKKKSKDGGATTHPGRTGTPAGAQAAACCATQARSQAERDLFVHPTLRLTSRQASRHSPAAGRRPTRYTAGRSLLAHVAFAKD